MPGDSDLQQEREVSWAFVSAAITMRTASSGREGFPLRNTGAQFDRYD